MVGRFLGTLGLMGLCRIFKYRSRLSLKELIFIWYAGLIRGAIAFGLVLRIDHGYVNRDVIVTTSLSLVVFTTVVFGSTVGLLRECLFNKKKDDYVPIKSQVSSIINEDDTGSYDVSSDEDKYLELSHPNMAEGE